jgi:serine phosphatase RsbU (regulator of sigma subunit)/anti-sigma regulatory factor (Ser/Thr protein kinase)
VNSSSPDQRDLAAVTDRILGRLIESDEGLWAALWVEADGRLQLLGSKGTGSPHPPEDVDPVRLAIAERRCVLMEPDPERPDPCHLGSWGGRTLVAPVESRLGTRGAIVVSAPLGSRPFDSRVVHYAQALAMHVVNALEADKFRRAALENELIAREMEIGSRMQQTLLLGELSKPVGFARVAHLAVPAQRIAGDFVEYFQHDGRCLDVLIGDVMGKGVQASLIGAAVTRQFHRTLCALLSAHTGRLPDPELIVSIVRDEIANHLAEVDSFVTLDYARIDPLAARLVLVDCGHTPVLHYHRKTRRCDAVLGQNMPLGFSDDEVYQPVVVPYEDGDLFVFYSDGVTEVKNARGELYGQERLIELVEARGGSRGPEELKGDIRESLNEFSGAGELHDDMTIVVIEVLAEGLPAAHRWTGAIAVTSELARLEEIRSFVRAACEGGGRPSLDADRIDRLELAVTEAASNIMIHAHHGAEDLPIGVSCETSTGEAVVSLTYRGAPFDPSAVAPPDFDRADEGGYGVYLIGECVDEVTYTHDGRESCAITLVSRQTRRAEV